MPKLIHYQIHPVRLPTFLYPTIPLVVFSGGGGGGGAQDPRTTTHFGDIGALFAELKYMFNY